MRAAIGRKPTLYDALAAAAVLLLAGASFLAFSPPVAQTAARTVVVTAEGAELDRFPLGETEREYHSRGYTLRVTATAEGVRVSGSDCPNRDCVHKGVIRKAGESIVCLPSRVVVSLTGAAPELDAVAG